MRFKLPISRNQLKVMGLALKNYLFELALRNNGNMYWFDIYLPDTKVPYDLFSQVVEFATSISDQSEKIKLNGNYKNSKWVFYYIGDDLAAKLSEQFPVIHFYEIPYFKLSA